MPESNELDERIVVILADIQQQLNALKETPTPAKTDIAIVEVAKEMSDLKVRAERKTKAFLGLRKWVIVAVLGFLSGLSQYHVYLDSQGDRNDQDWVVKIAPKEDTSGWIPTLYAVVIIAVATDNHAIVQKALARVLK